MIGCLDEIELGFEAGDEGFFLFDLVFSFFDKVLGGLVDVIWIHHASI